MLYSSVSVLVAPVLLQLLGADATEDRVAELLPKLLRLREHRCFSHFERLHGLTLHPLVGLTATHDDKALAWGTHQR